MYCQEFFIVNLFLPRKKKEEKDGNWKLSVTQTEIYIHTLKKKYTYVYIVHFEYTYVHLYTWNKHI